MNAKRQPDQRQRSFRWIAGAVLVLLGLLATAGFTSYRELAVVRDHEQDLQSRIQQTRSEIETLQERIERIQNDPRTLERIAREDLGMAHPDEIVILLPPDPQ